MTDQETEDQIRELMKEDKPKIIGTGHEAPASITYSIQTGTGFNALFTVRDNNGTDLLAKTPSIEAKFAELGIIPQPVKKFGGTPKVVVPGIKCPKCGSDVVEAKKRDGAIFHKCSTQKYFNGQTSGCDYVNWDPTGTKAKDKPMTVDEYEGFQG